MWAWGEKHWELWNSKECKWYGKASLKRWITSPQNDVLLLAKIGKRTVGMCVAHVIRDWAYCTGLFVERDCRGNGIGTALVTAMTAALRKKGAEEMILSVNAKNACALSLFRSFGFKTGYPSVSLGMQLRKGK